MRPNVPAAVALALLAASGCTRPAAPPRDPGARVAEGEARALSPSRDGARLAWLAGCGSGAGAGKGVRPCRLLAAPAAGGAARVVAEDVPAAEGAFAWSPDGALAALTRPDPATRQADLVVVRPGQEPVVVARRATAFAWGPDGRLALTTADGLSVAPPGGAPVPLPGGAGAVSPAVAPGGGRWIAAMVRAAGGVPTLAVWHAGGGGPWVVAREVDAFAFSPDGEAIAAIAGVSPGREGSLVVTALHADGGAPPPATTLARGVGEFRWAAAARRMAWLEGLDPRVRAGTLAAAVPGSPPVSFAPRVTSFEVSPAGTQVAYVRHVTDGEYAARLELSPTGAAEPGTVARDAASFEFSADGRWLYHRSGCAPASEACAVLRTPATGLGPGQSPERVADGASAFVLDPWRADRAIVAFARRDGAGVDVALWSGGALRPLQAGVLPGSARFLPPDGRRVAWIAVRPERAGVWVADAP